jgi:hypothetical protein
MEATWVPRVRPDTMIVWVGPHWYFAITFAAIAALPWLAWLPYRFSLRTLLIATTLVAVVLGVAVWVSR